MPYLRPAWAEVDTGAVTANVRALRACVGSGVAFMAVVKADAYGHGDVECARAALAGGADRLGIATIEEGVHLREAGVTAPVHMLVEPPASGAPLVVAHRLVPTVFTKEAAIALSRAAERAGETVDFHLKVDTGMNRIGVRAEEAAEFAETLAALPGLRMEGVFTHFATAEVPGDWDFDAQLERFGEALETMRERGIRTGVVHAANSAAAVLRPESRFDMVRCGIAVYGLHPADSTRGRVDLTPAMSVKAKVARVQR
ncbi:MAG: alanine racemase, partial [Actinobacteria bacterium]